MVDRPGPVLVTGANSGIGLASTLRFRGARVGHLGHGAFEGEGSGAERRSACDWSVGSGAPTGARRERPRRSGGPMAEAPAVLRGGEQRRLQRAGRGRRGLGRRGQTPTRRQPDRPRRGVVVRVAGHARAWFRAHRDGLVDRRPGRDPASQRVVSQRRSTASRRCPMCCESRLHHSGSRSRLSNPGSSRPRSSSGPRRRRPSARRSRTRRTARRTAACKPPST